MRVDKDKIKHALLWCGLVFAALIIESKLRLFGTGPNLLVVIAYAAGLRYGHARGLAYGILIGMAADGVAGKMMGPEMLAKGSAGYLAAYLKGGLFYWTPILGMIGLAGLTGLDGMLSYMSLSVFNSQPTEPLRAGFMVLAQAGINCVFGYFIRPEGD